MEQLPNKTITVKITWHTNNVKPQKYFRGERTSSYSVRIYAETN